LPTCPIGSDDVQPKTPFITLSKAFAALTVKAHKYCRLVNFQSSVENPGLASDGFGAHGQLSGRGAGCFA
jgi:hypothetical protein